MRYVITEVGCSLPTAYFHTSEVQGSVTNGTKRGLWNILILKFSFTSKIYLLRYNTGHGIF